MAGMSLLQYKRQQTQSITAQLSNVGVNIAPNQNQSTNPKTISLGTAAANSAAGGSDEIYYAILSIVGAGTGTLDLTSFTDLMRQTTVSLARVKEISIQLLSAADDSVNGTAASSVTLDGTVANGFTGQSHSGGFDNATSKLSIPNGGQCIPLSIANGAGVAVDGTHKILSFTNNDVALTAKVLLTVVGGSS